MEQNPYEKMFIERINRIYDEGYKNISHIQILPEDIAHHILGEILETLCLSGNYTNIELAKKAMLDLPPKWLFEHLPKVVPTYLFKEPEWQEWEFRRVAEVLQEHFPETFVWFIDYSKHLNNLEVDDAIQDFINT